MNPHEKGGKYLPNLVTTEQIKDIVRALNSPPFNDSLTLVSFDEKAPPELLGLLNRVMAHLGCRDEVKFDDKNEDAIYNMTEFLKILNFPGNFDADFQRGILFGDKKVIYLILHHILTQLPLMEKRAYLAKFLVNVYIPEDILMEEDIKHRHHEYKELQAEFQVLHQELEQLREENAPPQDFKREIDQLETEKEQLITKIARLKQKFGSNREYAELLEATSMLRKEQEEEALLLEKLQEQQQQLEWSEGNYLAAEQRLHDARKLTASETSALEMLNLLRADVKRNREFCNERLGRELSEKLKRLEQAEQLVNEPMVSQSDLENLQNEVRNMQREVQMLEERANAANQSDDKLGVYKQQAALVSKKKEKTLEKLKQLENEVSKLEKKKVQKEKEYEQARGGSKFLSGDEFHRYAQSLRTKKATVQQMKSQMRDIRAELAVLTRTDQILKHQAEEAQRSMRMLERQHGVEGSSQYRDNLEQISALKGDLDLKKGATLEEISKQVEKLDTIIKENRARLQPLVNELRVVRPRYQDVLSQYEAKKAQFDSIHSSTEGERGRLTQEVNTLKLETTSQEEKYHDLQAKTQLSEAMLKKVEFEQACRNEESRLNKDYKSLKEWYTWRLEQEDVLIKEYRNRQKIIKETHDISTQQVKMFTDLRKILGLKASLVQDELQGGRNALRGRDYGGEVGIGGRNILVLGDD